tara:strand:+ start:316 stop:660 length:345 start_codon:yes stop_codon:yes gene_type:complete
MNNIIFLYFAIIVISEIVAIWLLTEWSKNEKIYLIILGILSYVIVGIFFALLMRDSSDNRLAMINAFWQVIGLIAITVLGIYLYNEKLNTLEWIGLALTLIAVILFAIAQYVDF